MGPMFPLLVVFAIIVDGCVMAVGMGLGLTMGQTQGVFLGLIAVACLWAQIRKAQQKTARLAAWEKLREIDARIADAELLYDGMVAISPRTRDVFVACRDGGIDYEIPGASITYWRAPKVPELLLQFETRDMKHPLRAIRVAHAKLADQAKLRGLMT